MTPSNETVRALLAARAFLYAYVSRAFDGEPDEAFVAMVGGDDAAVLCSILGDSGRGSALQAAVASLAAEIPLDALKASYTRTLLGPGKLPASPWESVYTGHERLVFQKTTLDVRDFFRSEGYIGAGYPHEPDDHLGTELAFMATLARKAESCYECGDVGECERLLEAQRRFIDEHLLRWVGSYSEQLQHSVGQEPFYTAFASLAQLVCDEDRRMIEELLG